MSALVVIAGIAIYWALVLLSFWPLIVARLLAARPIAVHSCQDARIGLMCASRRVDRMTPVSSTCSCKCLTLETLMDLIARRSGLFGEITIFKNRRTGAHAYCVGPWYQSYADRAGVSLLAYAHAIYGLILQIEARRILVIGGAGATLPSMLARAGKRVTVVDIDPAAFEIAREFFHLAPDLDCRVGDGRAFLETTNARYDAIVMDAFCSKHLPRALCSSQFFALARSRLTRSGALIANAVVRDDCDRTAHRIAAGMAAAGLHVRLLDRPRRRDRNAVIVSTTEMRILAVPRLLMAPEVMTRSLAADLAKLRFTDPGGARPFREPPRRATVQADALVRRAA